MNALIQAAKLARQILLARTYILEVGLYHLLEGQAPSVDRTEILLQCFNTTKEYLNAVLSIAAESLTGWNCMDWRSLNYALMVNSRSATIIDCFCYCSESSRRAEWLDHCYDTLCNRVRGLGGMADLAQDHFLVRLSVDWANAKAHYHHSVNHALMRVQAPEAITPIGSFDVDDMYNISWSTFGGMWEWPDAGTY